MRMRTLMLAITLLTAACTPAPPAQQEQPPQVEEEHPGDRPELAQLSAAPHPGQWFFRGDDGTISAGFGPPASEFVFGVVCNSPTGRVELISARELVPDQDTTLRIITEAQTLEFAAHSSNEGLPFVRAELGGDDPRLDALAVEQQRFAVEVAGEASVFPWDESIPRALAACAE